jgi:hypothetical protein
MKAGDVFVLKANERIGLRLEAYVGNKTWEIQLVDIINNKPSRSYIFEKAYVKNINRFYNQLNSSKRY